MTLPAIVIDLSLGILVVAACGFAIAVVMTTVWGLLSARARRWRRRG
jgi:hypothetical protein